MDNLLTDLWVLATIGPCFAHLPGFPERLNTPGARFLDAGCGAGGITMHMCRQFPGLQAVGLDILAPAIKVAREDVALAGIDRRVEIREQSIDDLHDVEAYDLIWVPQAFIPPGVLARSLPRLFAAAKPGAAFVMALASDRASGVARAANEVRSRMEGGGVMPTQLAVDRVSTAGFTRVEAISGPTGDVVVAVRT